MVITSCKNKVSLRSNEQLRVNCVEEMLLHKDRVKETITLYLVATMALGHVANSNARTKEREAEVN